jgi:hypothetical protein
LLKRIEPWAERRPFSLHAQYSGSGTMHEDLAQVVVAALADAEEAGLTTGRVLSWHKPKPGRKLTPLMEGCAVTDRGYVRCCDQRANAGDLSEPLTGWIGRGIQYTPVDSIATVRTLHDCSQSANWCKSRVNVSNDRTDSTSRSAGTATKISSAPISTPAASGCITGSIRQLPFALLLVFLTMTGSLLPEPAARGYEISKLLNEIAAVADVITDLYVTSDPCFSTGFSSNTNVGRRL